MNVIASDWETERLSVSASVLDEVPRLCEIFNSCRYVRDWDVTFAGTTEEEMSGLVTKTGLNPKDPPELFLILSIREKGSGKIVGYAHMHHGMPRPGILFISMFVLGREYQKHGYGRELVAELANQATAAGYGTIWLMVYLKNWPAFRFWFGAGFDRIIEWRGDTVLSDSAVAKVVLEKKLGHGT